MWNRVNAKRHDTISGLALCSLIVWMAAGCSRQVPTEMDLSGKWRFAVDSLQEGAAGNWFAHALSDSVYLPGSMVKNGKGDSITAYSKWTGLVVDSSYFFDARYARYRKPGNVKIPFWLQPDKHYIGAAWYQREVDIPEQWAKRRIELYLERPHWQTTLWIDDTLIDGENRLATPHLYDLTGKLTPGKHTVTLRVDNAIRDVAPGENSHSITDHTQTNWNGIVGRIQLRTFPEVSLGNVQVYPNVAQGKLTVKGELIDVSGTSLKSLIKARVVGPEHSHFEESLEVELNEPGTFQFDIPMGDSPLLWDEFAPNLYTLDLHVTSEGREESRSIRFGMRDFRSQGSRFTINDRPVFLRGTLECAVFPKTGYPATDVASWTRIFKTIKAHGLNHVRFHSWCPPEAAFTAADEIGLYLQVEASSWANTDSSIGDGAPIDDWLYKEADAILAQYGNHPSFVLMAYGNEPHGRNQKEYLTRFVAHLRGKDPRRLYTGGAGWPYLKEQDFYVNSAPRIQGWGQGLSSIINAEPPQTRFDFSRIIDTVPMPYVSHEIGQWCAYPNFKEIPKYTGVLKAKNFEIFQETLRENHLGDLADSLTLASGKLQALCYKADIEAALRTKGFAGFQLLGLHDFPGQGTALVGVLDAFWEEKGYISPEEYRRFCDETVPLVRLDKRVFKNDESFKADIEVAHFGREPLKKALVSWQLTSDKGKAVAQGDLGTQDIPWGNAIPLGSLDLPLDQIGDAQQMTLTVTVAGFSNSWDLWVYPAKKEGLSVTQKIRMAKSLDSGTIAYLQNGGSVLLSVPKNSLKAEKGGDIAVGFSSIFWNTAWTKGQPPHTLGILCDPDHPALARFPTEYHSNWQWWDAMNHGSALVLDDFSPKLRPIVRIVDDWFQNRRTALIFEAKVGRGKLLVSGVDLNGDLSARPEAEQLLYSLRSYMSGPDFDPKEALALDDITAMFKK